MINAKWKKTWLGSALLFTLISLLLPGCTTKQTVPLYSGTIEGTEISVQSELGGAVKEIKIKEGDEVKAGQLLLKLDDKSYALQLEEAKAGVAAAQAKYDEANDNTRSSDFLLRNLEALVNQAKARQNQIQNLIDKTSISSPVDGTILYKQVESGEVTKPGATLFTILKKGELQVVVYVPESQLNQVKIGQKAAIKVDAYPDRSFAGKITRISNKAEFTPKNVQTPEERTKMVFAVTIQVSEGLTELKPGMPSDVTFTTDVVEGK